ncbi:MAG TPA: hypothetical protein VE913_10955 [Longimicrobium sp.]|nr:hypothetical protein [Longimicrobium sp.]
MSRIFRRGLFAAAAGVAAFAAAAPAQSVLAARGLGYPLEPVDARARALGGVGLGLPGATLSLVNPANPVGLPAPGVAVTFQPDQFDATAGSNVTSGSTARFPLIHVAFPIRAGQFTGSLAYGAFLDQNWRVSRVDSLALTTGKTPVRDDFVSDGGVARFRVGLGYRVSERLALGGALDAYTGAVRDSSTRAIGGFLGALSSTAITYTGTSFSAGARWTPLDALTVAASVGSGGTLHADADDELVRDRDYNLPVTVDAGASARITANTLLAVSGRWAGWSAADEDLVASGGARDVMSASAGLEFEGFSLLRQTLPVRLGARVTQLPFRWIGDDAEFPEERAISAGLGARLGRGAAQIDATVERGSRGGGSTGFDEPFWRLAFSLSVLGR